MFSIRIEDELTPLLDGMIGTFENVMQDLVQETSDVLTPFLRQNAPVGKHFMFDGTLIPGGELRNSLHFTVGQFGSYLSGAKQGKWVIGGTEPHPIRPKVASLLAFFWPKVGQGVQFKRVNHPGSKANDFRLTAVQQAFDEMAIQDVANRIMTQWVAGGGV
jgi:hypothetical protein